MSTWEEIKASAKEEGLPHALVAAETLQIAFLDGLYGEKESLDVTFHGGTAIRLLHGGYRYSEDLDFCVLEKKQLEELETLVHKAYSHAKNLMTLYLGNAGYELKKKERKKIPTWWFNVLAPGERQKYRVKIEFGLYPVYSQKALPIQIRNPFLPRQPLVVGTDLKELLADKLNALADRPFVKERDFFDLWYLRAVLKVPIDLEVLSRKLKDYHAKAPKKILGDRLKELDASSISKNMSFFLPVRYRQMFESNHYQDMMDVCRETIESVLESW